MASATDSKVVSSPEVPSLPLRGIFDVDKTHCDVVLTEEYVTWTLIQPASKEVKDGSHQQCLPLREVFAVRIKRYRREGRPLGYAQGITLFVRKPKRGSCLLRQGMITLCSTNEDTCKIWNCAIQNIIEKYGERPRRLRIFIDSLCENGNAAQVFHKKVQPVFELARVDFELTNSNEQGRAKKILEAMNYDGIDGIVCVGDDKIVTDVTNGLLQRTQSDANIPIKPDGIPMARCAIPVGIIPVGPFNLVAHSSQGVSDPITSALHIIYGTTQPVDVCTLYQNEEFVRFGFSAMYGFGGDCLRRAEKKKHLGKRRAEYAVARSVLKLRPYECEVSFLPFADVDGCIPDRTPCQTGCWLCQLNSPFHNPHQVPSWAHNSPVTIKKGYTLANFLRVNHVHLGGDSSADNSSISSYGSSEGRRTPEMGRSRENLLKLSNSPSSKSWTEGLDDYSSDSRIDRTAKHAGIPKHPGIAIHYANQQQRVEGIAVMPGETEAEIERYGWRTIKGAFFNVSLMTLPSICSLCPGGMSPQTHLADGSADLILTRTTTKSDFVQHLRRYASEKDQFDLPFMCVRRIKAVRIIPKPTTPSTNSTKQSEIAKDTPFSQDEEDVGDFSMWNIDMELYPTMPLDIRVHRQLLNVYGSGVAYVDKSPVTCGCL